MSEKTLTAADLPAMAEGQLDDAGLTALFADYVSCTEVLEVLEKGAARGHAVARTGGIGALLAALLRGDVRAAQVRYRYQGAIWSDTILRTPPGFRVVRCPLPWGE